jgi:WhiB family transcriptional regulator, redox-sensing transcriptional regulator
MARRKQRSMTAELGYWRPRQSGADDIADVLARTLLAAAEKTSWMDHAACSEIGDDALWFPEKGQNLRNAKRICQACEVRAECLEYALAHDERWGIWGGLSERQRRSMKRRTAGGIAA